MAADPVVNLPELHLDDWRPTKDTLHLYTQILGKIRLATTPPQNHWWNAALYTDVHGLSTRRLHHRDTTFELTLDLLEHALRIRTADGREESIALRDGLTVADFDGRLHRALRELGLDLAINEKPFGLAIKTPFHNDLEHAAWDREYVQRFAQILDWSDWVLEEFNGWFNGKTSPVHLFWHSFDLAVTRFSGRATPTSAADRVNQEAYSHELISFGFWPGDDQTGDAAYYSYTAPEPDGIREQPMPVGSWREFGAGSLAVLPYEQVRASPDPRATLLAFCQASYEAGAQLAGWDTSDFESKWCPSPEQLRTLRAAAAGDLGRNS